ncbi:unnamed protein product [Polarella glacialis]|uniref:Uncharacterized protein n=1 Tax=Polarella glacialis TaxID=89957 RepID=A0A813LCM4_POLGL|nr:unnamed protein product [Polarella glacialis]
MPSDDTFQWLNTPFVAWTFREKTGKGGFDAAASEHRRIGELSTCDVTAQGFVPSDYRELPTTKWNVQLESLGQEMFLATRTGQRPSRQASQPLCFNSLLLAVQIPRYVTSDSLCTCKRRRKTRRAGVHRCMCCTWCWGFCYCIFADPLAIRASRTTQTRAKWPTKAAFVTGNLAQNFQLSSICLILDDVDSQMLYDIGPAVGLNLTGPDGKMITTMIDQCFRNPDPKANPVLLNLIDVDDNGTTKTMYEMIVNKTKDSIDSQFDQISSSMSAGGSTSLVSEPSMVALMSTLGNSEMDGLMLPDKDKDWQNDVLYGDMGLDSRGSSGLATYWFNSSSKCSDYTVPADMGAASGKTIPGIDDYKNTLSFYGTPIAGTSCGKKVVCSALPGSTDGRACAAGNNFMQLKQDLQTINTFRCKMFYKNGALCYPDTMAETPAGSGNWAGDCFKADGTLEVKTEDCDLATFTALIQRFNPTLNKVLTRLDGATVSAMADINVNMRALVNLYIIDKITMVANGVTCGFLGQTYQGVIDGMCYGGVAGFVTISNNYVACAVLTLFLILLSYTFWRISLDNYNSGQKSLVADANAGAPGSEGANGVHAYVVK